MSINPADLIPLLPVLIVAGIPVLLMLQLALYRNHTATLVLTLDGLAAAFISIFAVFPRAPHQITTLLVIDRFSLFYMGLIIASGFVVALFSHGYLEKRFSPPGEFYILLTLALLGSMILVAATHFASFFLGLEILSVSLYGLIAYARTDSVGIEAGLKYLILAATSAAILLFGMALVYTQYGTMQFSRLASISPPTTPAESIFFLAALALILVGIGFKLALVPFHLWTPDVYQGAPAPVTAFIATVSKGAIFAILLRFFTLIHLQKFSSLLLVFSLIAIASMFFGNLLALRQNNVKRILAYSSIAHLGYLLVAFLAAGPLAVTAVTFYLVAYFVTTLGAFGVVTVLSTRDREAETRPDYAGLAWRRPWLAAFFTAMLLSLAGIPLTAGFVGKFFIMRAGVSSHLWLLIIILIVNSAIGLYYYLRVIVWIYHSPDQSPAVRHPLPVLGSIALAGLLIALLWLGVYPTPWIRIIESATPFFFY